MEITTELGPVSILTVTGKIDGNTFEQLVEGAKSVIQAGHKLLVLDFQGVSYLSSAGIVALQSVLGEINARDGRMALARVVDDVAQTLEVVGATEWLNLYPDVKSARASFWGTHPMPKI